MKKPITAMILIGLIMSNSQATNLDDWPCIQRYTPELSATVVWQQEPSKQSLTLNDPIAHQKIVDVSTNLRNDIPLIESSLRGYLEEKANPSEIRNLLFYDVFEHIQAKRKRILKGIFRYSEKQQKLAIRIDKQRTAISTALTSDQTDPAALEDLQSRQLWDSRAFRERKQQLTYLCEKPVKLEQRLFFIAKALNSNTAP